MNNANDAPDGVIEPDLPDFIQAWRELFTLWRQYESGPEVEYDA